MEGKKLFTCHLEVEVGQFPEYCVQDVCCGVYKQPNPLFSAVFWILTSLLIITLTCCIIYFWITYAEGKENNSQLPPKKDNHNKISKPHEPENKGKEIPDKAGKERKKEEPEAEENEECEDDDDEEEVTEKDDNETKDNKDAAKTNDSARENNKKRLSNLMSNVANENRKLSKPDPISDVDTTSTKSEESTQQPLVEDPHINSTHNSKNDNYQITYIREEYILPNGSDFNDIQKQDSNNQDSVANYKYNLLDIKTK